RDGVWYWKRIELLEISIVPIPANPQARITISRQLGIDPTPPVRVKARAADHAKAVTPYAALPLAPEETPWQWDVRAQDAVLGDPPNWHRYRRAHFWYDPLRPETKSSYKLPFAKMIDGELHAVWRGVAAAMAALLGARGGVDIPPQDRRPVYDHICRYYERFGKKPPDFRGTWPANLREVRFHHGELEIFAEERVISAASEMARLAADAAGILRHWRKIGRAAPEAATKLMAQARDELARSLTEAERAASGVHAGDGLQPTPAPHAAGQMAAPFHPRLLDVDALAAEVARRLDRETIAALLSSAGK
ncbi:MAG: hypothetical protein H5T86_16235, partial [Armatimonadetes bacterium]|nr:hypothetical protein [Armatimonadota bacterium]